MTRGFEREIVNSRILAQPSHHSPQPNELPEPSRGSPRQRHPEKPLLNSALQRDSRLRALVTRRLPRVADKFRLSAATHGTPCHPEHESIAARRRRAATSAANPKAIVLGPGINSNAWSRF